MDTEKNRGKKSRRKEKRLQERELEKLIWEVFEEDELIKEWEEIKEIEEELRRLGYRVVGYKEEEEVI